MTQVTLSLPDLDTNVSISSDLEETKIMLRDTLQEKQEDFYFYLTNSYRMKWVFLNISVTRDRRE